MFVKNVLFRMWIVRGPIPETIPLFLNRPRLPTVIGVGDGEMPFITELRVHKSTEKKNDREVSQYKL